MTGTQRWLNRSHRWQSEGDVVQTDRLSVRPISELDAKRFVVGHHYSASYPSASLRYGLVDTTADRLVGVCVLGVPMQRLVLTSVFPDLKPYSASLELSRLVLLDDPVVGANAESWMVARVFRLAAEEGVRGVVSFSDPVPRRRSDGSTVLPGHVGFIYQALGASYLGRCSAKTITVLPDGTVLSARSSSKVRSQDRGHEYVERRLERLGATPMLASEMPAEWLRRSLTETGAHSIRHGGNHRYAWAVGDRGQRRRTVIEPVSLPYPKSIDGEAA